MRILTLAGAAALAVFFASDALAFDASAPDGAPGASSTAPDAGARSDKSIECSQKADAQDLHGKPRKHFMRECKRGA